MTPLTTCISLSRWNRYTYSNVSLPTELWVNGVDILVPDATLPEGVSYEDGVLIDIRIAPLTLFLTPPHLSASIPIVPSPLC